MRVTQKGQVTIPKHIRDRLGIKPGSEVEFLEGEGETALFRRAEKVAERPYAARIRNARRIAGRSEFEAMDGKAYIDWLRGPWENVDPD